MLGSWEMSSIWYEKNKVDVLAKHAERYAANPEAMKAASLAYYYKHREECLQTRTAYRIKHRQAINSGQLMRWSGLTYADKDVRFAAQGSKCACCGATEPGTKRGWLVDHDHSKKKGDPGFIRGIVCHHCNSALHKNATAAWCRSMAAYLEAHNG